MKFGAKLLFQFRVVNEEKLNTTRICEERIIHFESETAEIAYNEASERGIEEEFDYFDNKKQHHVFFEFIGIQEFVDLDRLLEDDEVWYSFKEIKEPMENKNRLIPERSKLQAFKDLSGNNGELKL